MSKAGYTKGPWRVEEGTTLVWGACDNQDTTGRGMGYPVAEARVSGISPWAKGRPDRDEGKANAHLIAAAPDLYEACFEALAFMELTNVTGSLPDQLRTALNKARGLNGGGDETPGQKLIRSAQSARAALSTRKGGE